MLNSKILVIVWLSMLFTSSFQNESIQNKKENRQTNLDKSTEYAAEIFKNNESSKIYWASINCIRVESDLVNADHGCYTVNVRVYITANDGTVYLVGNENVQVSECGNAGRNGNSAKTKCEGSLPNGDYVVDNGTIGDKECLYDLLIENTKIYNLYLVSVDKTINGN